MHSPTAGVICPQDFEICPQPKYRKWRLLRYTMQFHRNPMCNFYFQAGNAFRILLSISRLAFVSSESDRDELTGAEVGDFFKYVTNFNMQLNHNVG
jgi:hypothetical protein